MSIYDNAGVALIPSGTKASKLYSVLPANGNGDFTHSRGSTATRVNKDGLIESVATNVPRLDYPLIDGVVQDCPALLLEPSRTNIIPNSQEYGTTNINTIRTRDVINAPDGTQTADRTVDNSVTGEHLLVHNISSSIVNGTTYSFSVFFKSDGSGGRGVIRWYRGSWDYAVFNLELGAVSYVSSGTATIENYDNGWYRCSYTVAAVADNVSTFTQIGIANSSNNFYYTGASSLGVYFWGAQFETGSYPTSYIPTSGGQATRSVDACNGSGTSAEFNDSEGVLFTEMAALGTDGITKRLAISNSSNTYIVRLEFRPTVNQIYGVVFLSPDNMAVLTHTASDWTQFNKVAVKYKQNDFAMWINGVEVSTDPLGSTGTGLDDFSFDAGNGGNDWYGKSKQLMTFKTALNDSELETLTSWDSFNAMATSQFYTIE
jgi:hypothetical protein